MSKPNLLILGPSRSGTTSLFHLLSQHPEIYTPKIKEPKYFTSNSQINPRNGPGDTLLGSNIISQYDDYVGLYSNTNTKFRIDASSDYFFYLPLIYSQIVKHCDDDLYVIVMLRNPYDRSYSSYLNLLRDNRYTGTFENYITSQEEWKDSGYDPMWLGAYGSLYTDRIKLLESEFNNHLVIYFDDFKNNSLDTLRQVESFLGVDKIDYVDLDVVYSPGYKKNWLSRFVSRDNVVTSMFRDLIIGLLGRKNVEVIASYFFKKNETSNKFENQNWNELFLNDIENLEQLVSKDLSSWK